MRAALVWVAFCVAAYLMARADAGDLDARAIDVGPLHSVAQN